MARITFECQVPSTYGGQPALERVRFQVEATSREEAFTKADQEAIRRGAVTCPFLGFVQTSQNNNTKADWEAVFGVN